jgi:signal peptidase I
MDNNGDLNIGLMFLIGFVILIGAVAKWKLYVKCDQPGIAAIIPIFDVIIFLRIVGRPASHIFLLLIPGFNVYFTYKLFIELVQCFGKFSVIDYVLVCVFNVFYLLNMGLAYNEEYFGPVYGKPKAELKARKPQLA